MTKARQSIFDTNAARLRDLGARIRETSRKGPQGPEHSAACAEFHDAYDGLAMPSGLERHLHLLREGDEQAVSMAVAFLSADTRFFRSGYIKEKILRRLKHAPLTRHQQIVLRRLILRSVDGGGRREFQGYARLAGVLDSPDVRNAMTIRLQSVNAEIRRRAREVLHVLESRHNERQSQPAVERGREDASR